MDTNRPIPVPTIAWIEKMSENIIPYPPYEIGGPGVIDYKEGAKNGAIALYLHLRPVEMMEYVIDTLATNGKRLQDRVDDLEAILEQKDERIMELEKKNLHLEDLRKMLRLALLEIKQSAGKIMADDSEDIILEI